MGCVHLPRAPLTPWLVGQFPAQNGGLVLVTANKGVNIVFVCGLKYLCGLGRMPRYRQKTYDDVGVGIEQIVS